METILQVIILLCWIVFAWIVFGIITVGLDRRFGWPFSWPFSLAEASFGIRKAEEQFKLLMSDRWTIRETISAIGYSPILFIIALIIMCVALGYAVTRCVSNGFRWNPPKESP